MEIDWLEEKKESLSASDYNQLMIDAESMGQTFFRELTEDAKSCRDVGCVRDLIIQVDEERCRE